MKKLLLIIAITTAFPLSASALVITNLNQGGTGWGGASPAPSATGDLLTGTTSLIQYSRFPKGANGKVLQASSSVFGMEWVATSTLGIAAYPCGSGGEIQFTTFSTLNCDPIFYWDNSNKRFGVGTSSPDSQGQFYIKLSTDLTPGTVFDLTTNSGVPSCYAFEDRVVYRAWSKDSVNGSTYYSSTSNGDYTFDIENDFDSIQISVAQWNGRDLHIERTVNGGVTTYYDTSSSFTDDCSMWLANPVHTPSEIISDVKINYTDSGTTYSIHAASSTAYFGKKVQIGSKTSDAAGVVLSVTGDSTLTGNSAVTGNSYVSGKLGVGITDSSHYPYGNFASVGAGDTKLAIDTTESDCGAGTSLTFQHSGYIIPLSNSPGFEQQFICGGDAAHNYIKYNYLGFDSNGNVVAATQNILIIQGDGKVGVNKTDATEALDVNGNVRLSGVFMPNNLPGASGQYLQSQGAVTPPIWTTPTTGNSAISIGNGFIFAATSTDPLRAASFVGTSTTATSTFKNASTTNLAVTGKMFDNTNSSGTSGSLLQTTGSLVQWTGTSTVLNTVRVTATTTGPTAGIGNTATLTVNCGTGYKVQGGGGSISGNADGAVLQNSYPASTTAWTVDYYATLGIGASGTVTGYAICQ